MLDRKGVIYKGRPDGIDQWKSRYAIETDLRTLEDAINEADVFLGPEKHLLHLLRLQESANQFRLHILISIDLFHQVFLCKLHLFCPA